MHDICVIGTQGKQPATKARQDSLFTGKHSEIAMRSEPCVKRTQGGIFYAGKGLFFTNIFYFTFWITVSGCSISDREGYLIGLLWIRSHWNAYREQPEASACSSFKSHLNG